MTKTTIAIALALMCGCVTTQPTIESTKAWENHYYTVEEFEKGTSNIQLDKDESIWVLSNKTLNRLLKSTRK